MLPVLSVPGKNVHFVVTMHDVDGSAGLRRAFGPAHREYAATIRDRIVLAGPIYADDGVTSNGSVFVVNFETRAEVADFIAADPFVINGVYRDWTVVLFKNIWTQD